MWESPVEEFEGLSLSSLSTDEAYVRVRWESQTDPAWLYHLDSDCHLCPWQLLGSVTLSPFKVKTHHTNSFLLRRDNRTRYPFQSVSYRPDWFTEVFRFITTSAAAEDPGSVCQVSADLGEFGVYDLELSDGSCTLTEKLAPVSANLALLVVFLVFAAAGVVWWALNRWAAVHLNKAAKLLGWDKVRERDL